MNYGHGRSQLTGLPHRWRNARVPAIRWTREEPTAAFRMALRNHCLYMGSDTKKRLAMTRFAFGAADVTAWAMTRIMLESYYETLITPLRRQRIARILDAMPGWGFEPTPTNWSKDGYPPELA